MREGTYFSLVALLEGPGHGYAILERIQRLSGGEVKLAAGTLYAVLERLVDEGLIRRAGTEVVRGRARQYFEITDKGSIEVEAQAERMAAAAKAVRRARVAYPVRSGGVGKSRGRLAPEASAFT